MDENSSARYYLKSRERLQKKFMKGIEVFLKKKKKVSINMVANNIKIFQTWKTKFGWI